MAERVAVARWDGGLRAVVTTGEFETVVDEPESVGGTNTGPQPTDVLLAAVASCFTLAMAYSAGKRGESLPGLVVTVTGTYDGPRFAAIDIAVRAEAPRELLERLIPAAEQVCYVTNTLRSTPEIRVSASA